MEKAVCPHCGKETIEPMQRVKAEFWRDVYCKECGGRSAMAPIVLAILWAAICWDVFFFGFMAVHEKSVIYGAIMVVGWGLLQFFGYYIPLVRLRSKTPTAS